MLSQLDVREVRTTFIIEVRTYWILEAGVNKQITSAVARARREKVAKATKIAPFIKCNPWQGANPPPSTVLSLAISALVCACWLDSNQNCTVARQIISRLG